MSKRKPHSRSRFIDDYDSGHFDERDERNIPIMICGNFYCGMCITYMNSENMWVQHVNGKRHLTNLRKGPYDMPSKVKSFPCSDTPRIQNELDNMEEPIVGLDYIIENKKADPSVSPLYNCLLCQGCFTVLTIFDHLLSTKHRMFYLKEASSKDFRYIDKLKLNTTQRDSLVEERSAAMEDMKGRGIIQVKVEKIYGQVPDLCAPATSSRYGRHRSARISRVSSRRNSPAARIILSTLNLKNPKRQKFSRKSSIPSSSKKVAIPRSPKEVAPGPSRKISTPRVSNEIVPPSTSVAEVSSLNKWIAVMPTEEHNFNLRRDVKHLSAEQKNAILKEAAADVKANKESYISDSAKLPVLFELLGVHIGQHLHTVYKNFTPQERKVFKKYIFTDHPFKVLCAALRKCSKW